MKVSIIVPNRNYGQYLPACLDSIAVQTYQNIEVLLADGGSTDDSVEIMQYYAKRYGWEFFSRSDTGQVDAIVRGLERSNGDIQCWLNSDDFFLSNKAIEIVIEKFEEFLNVDIVSLGGYYTDESGHWLRAIKLQTHPLFRQNEIALRGGFVQPATFWKKEVFQKIGLKNTYQFVFDQHFLIEACLKYNMLIQQDVVIAGYRLHNYNLSIGVKSERIYELAILNGYFFSKNYREYYLKFIAFLVNCFSYLPQPLEKRINHLVYLAVNILSYLTVYRLPSI